MIRGFKLLCFVAVLAGAAGLYGCASSSYVEPTLDNAAACQVTAASAAASECNADDVARQARDAADYQSEPALGYLSSPPGMLPIPVTSRNTSSN
jgi:hypothetical protein